MTTRVAALLASLLLMLAACSSSSDPAGSGSDGSGTAGGGTETTAGDAASDPGCGDLEGDAGVLRTFCSGGGTASFTIGGTEGEIDGGECETGGGYFSFNAGVVTSGDFEGTAPDYAGFSLPEADGDFSGDGVAASITFDGEAVAITDATGSHDGEGGTIEGTSITDGTPVSVTFTCS